MSLRCRSRWFAVLLGAVALAAGTVATAPAGASNGKQFILKMETPVGSSGTVTATITNPSDAQQQLGSANLTPPSGLTVTSATVRDRGTARVAGGIIELRDLALAPGATAVATLAISSGCTAGSAPWAVVAKQANDFNGTGNEIALWRERSTLTTSVTGGCKLVWKEQPQNAQVGNVISGTDYVPGGPDVALAVVDGADSPVAGVTGGVALEYSAREGDGVLAGSTSSLANGLVTFPELRINAPARGSGAGTYNLVATVTSGPYKGVKSVASDHIRLSDVVKSCTDLAALCSQGLSRPFAEFAVNALPFQFAPFLTMSGDAGLTLSKAQCSDEDWTSYGSTTVLFDVTAAVREKTISATIPRAILQVEPDNGAPRIHLCFASPDSFTRRGGPPSTPTPDFDWDHDGTPTAVHAGLLADCSSTVAPPCISQRKKISGGRGYIEARLPAKAGDPAMRG